MNKICEISFLGRGFRPFFFLGAIFAVISIALWGGSYINYWETPSFMNNAVLWHAHEMVFGYTIAIIAGFLLTAVANWTGGSPVRQLQLLALTILWVLGRIVMSIDIGLPFLAVCIIELAFIPALAISLAIPLFKKMNKRNFVFLGLLSVLWGLNLWFIISEDTKPLYLATLIIMIMISLIGGRVIPAFTIGTIRQRGEEAFQIGQPKTDILALISLLSVMIAFVLEIEIALAITSFFTAIVHLFRFRLYQTKRILKEPIMWILHVGYLWLVVGLIMFALSALYIVPQSTALHIFTAGAIGSMTIGMMCRVTMGHTGRKIKANILTIIAFVMMQIVVILRVFLPLIMPEQNAFFMASSAVLWSSSFLLFLIVYTPMLLGNRPDGKPA